MHTLTVYFIVFIGAGAGGALRHGINSVVLRLLGSGFPYGTLMINVVGSLVIGLFAGWFAFKTDPGQMWRLFLTTGLLGGFTTFSAFSLDAALLHERGETLAAAGYALGSVGASFLCVFLGLWLIRAIA